MIKALKYIFLFISGSFLIFSCNVTKHLKDNEKLLVKNKIEIVSDKKTDGLSEDDLQTLIIPRPNSKSMFMRLNLRIYNILPGTYRKKTKKKVRKM